MLVGNTDDHPRNHAAFFDSARLELTPAYDVCPQPRSGGEATQAMAYDRNGQKASRLATCVQAAAVYGLRTSEAQEIVDRCVVVVREQLDRVCADIGVSDTTYRLLSGRAVANPSVFYPGV